ncbi:hypothetical protein ABW20_dc0110484 [Dactylellina cionopaga]|nr:hypothetical protein ABW20_dc0110484 [Dactylellina cionopaga]
MQRAQKLGADIMYKIRRDQKSPDQAKPEPKKPGVDEPSLSTQIPAHRPEETAYLVPSTSLHARLDRLSTEILTQILFWQVDRFSYYSSPLGRAAKLSLVCRRFSEILLSRLYRGCARGGIYVKKLNITTDASKEQHLCCRYLPSLLALLLPTFQNLVEVSCYMPYEIPAEDVIRGIEMMVTSCLSLTKLDLSVSSSKRSEFQEVKNRLVLEPTVPHCHLETLSIDYYGAAGNEFMNSMLKVLEPSMATVKDLNFGCKVRTEPTVPRLGSWKFPQLEKFSIQLNASLVRGALRYLAIDYMKLEQVILIETDMIHRMGKSCGIEKPVVQEFLKMIAGNTQIIHFPSVMEPAWVHFFFDEVANAKSLGKPLPLREISFAYTDGGWSSTVQSEQHAALKQILKRHGADYKYHDRETPNAINFNGKDEWTVTFFLKQRKHMPAFFGQEKKFAMERLYEK